MVHHGHQTLVTGGDRTTQTKRRNNWYKLTVAEIRYQLAPRVQFFNFKHYVNYVKMCNHKVKFSLTTSGSKKIGFFFIGGADIRPLPCHSQLCKMETLTTT